MDGSSAATTRQPTLAERGEPKCECGHYRLIHKRTGRFAFPCSLKSCGCTGYHAARQSRLLVNATIAEERWDAEGRRMIYRVEYDAEVAQ